MTFAAPYFLLALVLVPLAGVGYWWLERRRSKRSAAWSTPEMLPNSVRRPPKRLGLLPATLFLLSLTFVVVAFARPERILHDVQGGAPTIVLSFDVSGSMAAQDVQPTRLRAARNVALRFLRAVPARDRVAVMTFGNDVRLIVPPTFDRARARAGFPTTITPLSGTAIGDAVGEGASVIVRAAGKSHTAGAKRPGLVVLFSDGAQTAGGTTPQDAAVIARVDGIPVDTVAIGTRKGVVDQPFKVNGTIVTVPEDAPVDKATLRIMSQQTRGTVLNQPTSAELKQAFVKLGSHPLPGSRKKQLSTVAAAVALGFVLAGIAVSGLIFGRIA